MAARIGILVLCGLIAVAAYAASHPPTNNILGQLSGVLLVFLAGFYAGEFSAWHKITKEAKRNA